MSCSVVTLSSLTVPVSTLASAGDAMHAMHARHHQSAVLREFVFVAMIKSNQIDVPRVPRAEPPTARACRYRRVVGMDSTRTRTDGRFTAWCGRLARRSGRPRGSNSSFDTNPSNCGQSGAAEVVATQRLVPGGPVLVLLPCGSLRPRAHVDVRSGSRQHTAPRAGLASLEGPRARRILARCARRQSGPLSQPLRSRRQIQTR